MIRFSAALVAVAIGVLIGGIATSKLLLVYIAIVVSAVALVALAIGVVLKREELFREGQGLVPVGAGAGSVPSRVGVVAPPPPYAGAAGAYGPGFGGTGFGGKAQPAPTAAVHPGPVPTPAVPASSQARTPTPAQGEQGRSADSVPPWETPAARGQWQSPAPDWLSAGQSERAAAGRAGGWGSPPANTGAGSGSLGAGSGSLGAGSGSGAPSWFERLGSQPAAEAPAARPTSAPGSTGSSGSGSAWPWSANSWLERDADGSDEVGGEAAKTVAVNVADAERERMPPPPVGTDDAGRGGDTPVVTPDAVGDPGGEAEVPGGAVIAFRRSEGSAGHSAIGDEDEDEDDSLAVEPGSEGEADAPGEDEAKEEPSAASEPTDAPEAAPVPETTLVTVVPGVPRYHKPDCVLIRFMPDEDVRQLSAEEAKEAGCTPCAACQPAK